MTTKVEKTSEIENLVLEDDGSEAVISTLDNDGNIETQVITQGEVGPQFDPLAAVGHALNGEPSEFEDQIKLGLADRIQDAIERKRDEAAQSIFGTQDQEVETDDLDANAEIPEEDNEVDSEEDEE